MKEEVHVGVVGGNRRSVGIPSWPVPLDDPPPSSSDIRGATLQIVIQHCIDGVLSV